MNEDLTTPLKSLPGLQRPALLELWSRLFATPPHPKLRRNLMIPILAYRLQEKALGGLKPATRARLQRMARQLELHPDRSIAAPPGSASRPAPSWSATGRISPTKSWLWTKAFAYGGRRYTSLSDIARHITGTRWSGPVFFGLKPSQKKAGH